MANPTTNSWQELDADTFAIPAAANGLIFRAENNDEESDLRLGFRHADSLDDWNKDLGRGTHFQAAIGLRADNVWDQYVEEGDEEDEGVSVSIAAYTTGPAAVSP